MLVKYLIIFFFTYLFAGGHKEEVLQPHWICDAREAQEWRLVILVYFK